jgi:predicted methyltransferase
MTHSQSMQSASDSRPTLHAASAARSMARRLLLPLASSAIIGLLAMTVSSCASHSSGQAPAAEMPKESAPDPKTAAALDKILAGDQRSAANRARDDYRHPKETLLFFGIQPDMKVVEIWPGPGGWYTEILAPLLRDHGKLYAAQWDTGTASQQIREALDRFNAKLATRPDLYDRVEVTALSPAPSTSRIAPDASVDMILTFRNMHNWLMFGWTDQAFGAMYKALKPGGILGVVDHRGDPTLPQDPKAASGYVDQKYAIQMIEAAGFKFVASSEINANPKDDRNHPQGVWTLPPSFALGDTDREKYAAIGESDRFTLKFIKPRG